MGTHPEGGLLLNGVLGSGGWSSPGAGLRFLRQGDLWRPTDYTIGKEGNCIRGITAPIEDGLEEIRSTYRQHRRSTSHGILGMRPTGPGATGRVAQRATGAAAGTGVPPWSLDIIT